MWDSRDTAHYYTKKDWPAREEFGVLQSNERHQQPSGRQRQDTLPTAAHQLGLIKQFTKALDQWFPTTVTRHTSVPRRDCIRRYTPTYGSSSKEAPGATVPLTFTIIILYPVLNTGYVLYVNENFPYMIFIFYYFIAKRVYE